MIIDSQLTFTYISAESSDEASAILCNVKATFMIVAKDNVNITGIYSNILKIKKRLVKLKRSHPGR